MKMATWFVQSLTWHWTGNQIQFGILLSVNLTILTINSICERNSWRANFLLNRYSTTSIAGCNKAHCDAQQTFDMGYTRALRLGWQRNLPKSCTACYHPSINYILLSIELHYATTKMATHRKWGFDLLAR